MYFCLHIITLLVTELSCGDADEYLQLTAGFLKVLNARVRQSRDPSAANKHALQNVSKVVTAQNDEYTDLFAPLSNSTLHKLSETTLLDRSLSAAKSDTPKPKPAAPILRRSASSPEPAKPRAVIAAPSAPAVNTGALETGKLFGVSLQRSVRRSDPKGLVPTPVRVCCAFLMNHLHHEGIFRRPGSNRQVAEHIKEWDQDPGFQLDPAEMPENACSCLVQFLMRIKEDCEDSVPMKKRGSAKLWGVTNKESTVFTRAVRQVGKDCRKCPDQAPGRIRDLIMGLPVENQATFKLIASLLKTACEDQYTETSKMDSKKFGLCVAPAIQWGMQMMIDHYDFMFELVPDP